MSINIEGYNEGDDLENIKLINSPLTENDIV